MVPPCLKGGACRDSNTTEKNPIYTTKRGTMAVNGIAENGLPNCPCKFYLLLFFDLHSIEWECW